MSDYKIRSLCPCGWYDTPVAGSRSYSKIDFPCCPSCGALERERTLVAGREIPLPKGWFETQKYRLEVRND